MQRNGYGGISKQLERKRYGYGLLRFTVAKSVSVAVFWRFLTQKNLISSFYKLKPDRLPLMRTVDIYGGTPSHVFCKVSVIEDRQSYQHFFMCGLTHHAEVRRNKYKKKLQTLNLSS